jgi:hypothetical protein
LDSQPSPFLCLSHLRPVVFSDNGPFDYRRVVYTTSLMSQASSPPSTQHRGADSVPVSADRKPCIISYTAMNCARPLTRFLPTQAISALAKLFVKRLLVSPNAFASRISTKRPHTSRSPQGAGHTRGRFSDNCWRVRARHAKMPDIERDTFHHRSSINTSLIVRVVLSTLLFTMQLW